MKRILLLLLLTPLLSPVFSTGCTSYRQLQLEQTMLLQENQRLEDALYVTHSQLVNAKQENEVLQESLNNSSAFSTPAKRSKGITQRDAADDAPLFPPSQIEIPPDSELKSTPEKSSLPDLLKKTQKPVSKPPKTKAVLPDLLPPDMNVADGTPVWEPTR